MACVAMMCGYKSYSAMAEWERNYGGKLVKALGFTHQKTPCASTLHTVFRNIDKEELEAKLGSWAEGGGDYVMIVKENQPKLLDDVKTVFHGPYSHLLRKSSAQTLDIGHGRIEERYLTASDELSDYSHWPGLEQVFQLSRKATILTTGKVREETVYGVTSLSSEQAGPGCLLEFVRCHWRIENRSFWVRDVTFDEDRSQARCGNIPQVMAAMRNLVIGLMRWLGYTNMAAACRYFAARPWDALEAIGIRH